MAAINAIAKDWADELRDGIAWVIVWKTGRSWNATAVWLNSDDDTFEPEDLEQARKILAQDPNAVMLNGYYCGHFGEDMTVAELAAGIRWHYENGYNLLDGSTAFPPEPMEHPADHQQLFFFNVSATIFILIFLIHYVFLILMCDYVCVTVYEFEGFR